MIKVNGLVLVSLVFITTVFSCTAQNKGGKGSLFIIGGGSRPESMVNIIASESGLDAGGYAVILPMSSEEPDSAIYFTKGQFAQLGFTRVFGLQFQKGEKPNKAKTDSIRNARLVYISGGDQSRFMGVVAGTDIERAIHDAYDSGAMVAGTSAGAAVMSKVMITGNELKHPDYSATFENIEADNIETSTGLGMLQNAIIDQHFVKRSRHNRLISAVIEFPDMICIGIDESTAILVKGNVAEVVGKAQVLVFTNPLKSKEVKDGRLGARGLKLDVYLPGDTFELNE